MVFDIYNPHKNQSVTADYVSIIEESLKRAGHTTNRVSTVEKNNSNREKGIVCIQLSTIREAKKCGYGKTIRWIQGVVEDESYMRNHSRLRYWILSLLNKNSFHQSDFILFCSDAMKRHYERRFKCNFDNYYIMPCFNDEINKEAFFTEDKYKNNVFVFAGSLEVWQCFEPTVALYREVEKKIANCSFRALVSDRKKATEIFDKYGVERYSIDFVPKERVAQEMAKAKFGFCIREDSIVNRVATPTKFSSYISNGVIPVYSQYTEDFHNIAKKCKYCVCANPNDLTLSVDKIVELCTESNEPIEIYNSYKNAFGQYYSREYHIEKLTEALTNTFSL